MSNNSKSGFRHICKSYKDSGGMMFLVVGILAMTIYLQINARILQWISLALENPKVTKWAEYVIIGCLVNIVLDIIMTYTSSISIHKAFTDLNNRISDKIINADYSLFVKKSCSDIISTAESLWKTTNLMVDIKNVIIAMVKLIVNIVMIYTIRKEVVIPIMVVIVLTGIGGYKLIKIWADLDKRMDNIARKRNAEIDEIVNGFAEVRSFGTHNKHREAIYSMNESILGKIVRRNTVSCLINFLSETGSGALTILVLLYSITKILNGELNSSTGVILVMYVWRMEGPIFELIDSIDNISSHSVALPKIAELLDYENEIKDGCIELDGIDNTLTFKNVSFSYDKSSSVLKNISLDIKKGQKIGICGPTGGGKSTLLKLIPRFYDVTDGSIQIDGLDIRDLNLKSLRKYIGIVQQDPYIFESTIYENIIYGNWECTENDVIEACKKASIYDFIQTLPDKLKTNVGPRGLKLSGGQKQRIALARVFLSNPDIILLDEATSALDNETESIIQESLEMFKDKTMIVVAHRLTTIKDSDKIVVISDHEIAEEGTHEELMLLNGLYSKMYRQ